jgi:DNA-directed RNA polymerase specialized sigma24 family protein
VLKVLLTKDARPRRTTTGLEALQHEALRREGALFVSLQGNGAGGAECSQEEAREEFVARVQKLIVGWPDLERAILALRMTGATVREIKSELGVSADRICAVIRAVRRFYETGAITNLGAVH